MKKNIFIFLFLFFVNAFCNAQARQSINFNKGWKFLLSDDSTLFLENTNSNSWRTLGLPHDWSIESDFKNYAPATNLGGSLPGGIGWYRKEFVANKDDTGKITTIKFDGVYRNSEVWINENYLGKRPNGYVNFEYDISNYLKPYPQKNIIVVKVDNSLQPNSRWYTGSGIYRDVVLEIHNEKYFIDSSIFITTPTITKKNAIVDIKAKFKTNYKEYTKLKVRTIISDLNKKIIFSKISDVGAYNGISGIHYPFNISKPLYWSIDSPNLYTLELELLSNKGRVIDEVNRSFGFRSFYFDKDSGFILNNKPLKIQGVCMHHDLGIFGAAFNKSAAHRQLQLLKDMGCNAIRFSHNPPSSAMLDLCDAMGFLVIDEAFDMWNKKKTKYDYSKNFKEWYKTDLEAMVLRDRNHPSVILWSIGNEIREQFDSSAKIFTKELVDIVKRLDDTRPVTSAMTETNFDKNFIAQSNALDVLGFNYKDFDYEKLQSQFPNQKFLATETASALATRGVYQMPSDTDRIWPPNYKVQDNFTGGNDDFTCASYDNTYAYWGNTHERSWLAVKKNKFMAGAFVWSGFDYLGEPTPNPFPARSSYFGIIDLAGFPKDVYYMYQSEWSKNNVLHLLPHWNWTVGDTVDVWAYYNNADEVELFVNNISKGIKKKSDTTLHVMWKLPFVGGELKAISRKDGKIILTKIIKTTEKPYAIKLVEEKHNFLSKDNFLKFVQAYIVDKNGKVIPNANNEITFKVNNAEIVGTDNGYQADTNSLKSHVRKAWKGKCVAIVKLDPKKGNCTLSAFSNGLKLGTIALK